MAHHLTCIVYTAIVVLVVLIGGIDAAGSERCGSNCTSNTECVGGDENQCTECSREVGFCITPYETCPADVACRSNRECISFTGPLDPDLTCLCAPQPTINNAHGCGETYSGFCGTVCESDADCDIGGGFSMCKHCMAGQCEQGSCSPNGTTACSRNTECGDPETASCACTQIAINTPFTCQNGFDEWCGTKCVDDSDCPQSNSVNTNCRVCAGGICSLRTCGSACRSNQDCENSGDCNSCISGRCAVTPGGCGFPCHNASSSATENGCNPSSRCGVCGVNSDGSAGAPRYVCQEGLPPGCSQSCNSVTDCGSNPECNYCDLSGGGCTVYDAATTKGPAPGSPELYTRVRYERAMKRAGVESTPLWRLGKKKQQQQP